MKHEHAKKQNDFNYALFCSSIFLLFLSKFFTAKIVAGGLCLCV